MSATTTDYSTLTGTYAIDTAHSRLGFVARHAMVTKVRGAFSAFEGTATIDGDKPENSTVSVTVDVASIETRNAGRDEHLRSNDFLDVPSFPTITFTSTAIANVGDADFEVTGDLTIKGVTREVVLPLEFTGAAQDPMGNSRIGFEGSLPILRGDYGITWNAALEAGGVLVSDKIVLEFDISAIKQG